MLIFTSPYWIDVFFARMVMPFSRSRSIESITRSLTSAFARNAPDCHNMASTRVVLPWSTWATMATLRMFALAVTDRGILLADEPTGALDSRTSLDIMALFQALNREGMTVLVVTHEPDVAEFARRVIRFRDGKVIEDRTQEPRDAATALAALDAENRETAA